MQRSPCPGSAPAVPVWEGSVRGGLASRTALVATLILAAPTAAGAPGTGDIQAAAGPGSAARWDVQVYFAGGDPGPADFVAWEPRFDAFSRALFDATEGQLALGQVTFTACEQSKAAADVWITCGDGPGASDVGGFGLPGAHLTLTQDHLAGPLGFRADADFVHQAGHYLWGLRDEHRGVLGTQPAATDAHFCDAGGNSSLMDVDQAQTPGVTEFCVASTHNDGAAGPLDVLALTEQERVHGGSCWDRIVASGVGGLSAPSGTPGSSLAGFVAPTFEVESGELALMLAIDRSGSMFGEPLVQAKLAASIGVGLIDPGASAGFLSFGGSVSLTTPLAPASAGQKQQMLTAIEAMQAGGGTPLGLALITAQAQLDLVEGCNEAVLLVSDGTQTMARDLMECERMLDGQVPLLGVVLNRARKNSIPRYA